jgi:2-methylcitrate dehydratase PrpD
MSAAYSLTGQLAKHLQRDVDAETRQRARLHLLDWLACVVGARGSDVAQCFPEDNEDIAAKAAFLGNILEMDDVHRTALLHPGPVIWPTVLYGDCDDMDEMLDAAVHGYEAMIAIGETFDAHHYAHYHPTSTAGLFGAAAGAAQCMECSEQELVMALGLAGSVSGGLWQTRHEGPMAKQWHVMHAMMSGAAAAYYARLGMNGPTAILEGPQGLYAATCRDPKPMALPDQWRIHEVSFKPWAACRHAHPVIDCALELRAAGQFEPPFVVETYADAIAFCDRPDPVTETEAKFSLQHAVAVIADGRSAGPEDFTPAAIAALAPLRAQVTVTEDPAITARYPAHFGARVNGLELTDTRGDPERPLDQEGLLAKVHGLFKWGGLNWAEANRAIDLALHGEDAEDLVEALEGWLG